MGRKHLQEKADKKKEHTLAREAFFIDFATQIRKRFPNVILMVTGGNRSRQGAEALVRKAGDLVGFARPAAVNPNFPRLLVDESIPDEEARVVLAKVPIPAWTKWLNVKAIGGGAESVSILVVLPCIPRYSCQCRRSMPQTFVDWRRGCTRCFLKSEGNLPSLFGVQKKE